VEGTKVKHKQCPACGGRLRDESLGWKCERCRGFIDMRGVFHEHVERPFMPPMTNADHIRAMSDEDLAGMLAAVTAIAGTEVLEIPGGFNDPYLKQITMEAAAEFLEWLREPADMESFLAAFGA
jgi:hypothetical protein